MCRGTDMLNLEILESRLLLSVIITDNDTNDVTEPGYVMEFRSTDIGHTMLGRNSLQIENEGPDTISIQILNPTDPAFKIIPQDNLPLVVAPGDVEFIDLGFSPWEIKEYAGTLDIGYMSSQTGWHVENINLLGEGREGKLPFDPEVLGDLSVTDVSITTSNQTMIIRPGDSFEVSITVANVGDYPIARTADLHVSYSDDPNGVFSSLVINNSLKVDALAVGQSQTFSLVVLPEDIPDILGPYHIVANVDPYWRIPEYGEGTQTDAPNHLASPEIIFDLVYDITDSSGSAKDYFIEFPDTGRGQVSDAAQVQYVTVTNKGNQPLEVYDLNIPGNDFSLQTPPRANLLYPPALDFNPDDALPIALGQVIHNIVIMDDEGYADADVFSFYAQQGDYITVEIQSEINYTPSASLYTDHGDPILPGLISLNPEGGRLSSASFPAFYSGKYYLTTGGTVISSDTSFQFQVTAEPDPMPELFPSRQGDAYSDTLKANEQLGVGLEELRFNAEYGEVIQFEIQTITTNLLGQPLDTSGQVIPWLYNQNGSFIPLSIIEDNDITLGGVVAPDEPQVFEFTSYNTGAYYLYLQYFTSPNEQMNLNLKIRETDNILNLEPGEQVDIPVWFTPQNTGPMQDHLQFLLDTGFGDPASVSVELAGNGLPGDYFIKDLQLLDLMFPHQVQSGMPLTITGAVSNMGYGDITESTQVQLALSADDLFGNDDDIPLEAMVNIDPLLVYQAQTFTVTLDIPDSIEGNYYLLAAVNPTGGVDEYPDDSFDYPNVVVSESLEFSHNSIVVVDSVDNQFDQEMDFGIMDLGSFRVEIVSLHNRSSVPVTLVSMDLTSDYPFQPFGLENPDLFQLPFVIQPKAVKHIPVVFAPDTFPPTGVQFASGDFTFFTDENLNYNVNLFGMLGGPDLIVREPEFETGIDLLQFDPTLVGQMSETLPIEIANLGNEPLTVNAMQFVSGADAAFSFVNAPQVPFQLTPNGSPGDSVSFMVGFAPTSLSHFVDTLIISSNVIAGDYQIRLDGQGVAPKLKVYDNIGSASDDKQLPFGWRPVGQPSQATVTLVNEGNYTLQVFDWFLNNENPDDFSIAPVNLPDTTADDIVINPQGSFELTVTFNAPAEGLFSDTLVIHSNDGERLVQLSSLSGESTQPSLEFVYLNQPFDNGDTLTFGSVPVGQSLSRQLRLRNDGLVEVKINLNDLNIFGAGLSFTAPELFNASQGELTLQPGDYFSVNVRFDAQVELGVGSFNGYLVANSTSPESMTLALNTITVTPEIDVNHYLNFGALSPQQQLTLPLNIANIGSADLIINQWYIDNNQFEIKIPAENISDNKIIIAPNQSLSAGVICKPTVFGPTQASLSLISNDLDESIDQIVLSVYNIGEQIEVLPGSPRSFRDLNNQLVHVSITDGRALFSLENGSIGGADIDTLHILESNDATKLDISVRGEQTVVGAVISDNSLASINAPKVNITDAIDINGSLEQLSLANIQNFVDINVDQTADNPLTVKVKQIGQHVDIDFAGDLKLFQADSFDSGTLIAGAVNNLNIKKGNFGADLMTLNLDKLNVRGNITGAVRALNDIGKVISKNGAIAGELVAQNGSIDKVSAPLEISGGIYAQNLLNSVTVKNGDLSAELRAHTINNVKADGLDHALISAWYINKVKVNVDAVDSYLLAGFDVGMKGLGDPTDDYLYSGELGSFRFGGEIRNTFVAVGVMPNRIYDSLSLPKAAGAPISAGIGSIDSIKGKNVVTNPAEPEFGFYAAQSINTNLNPRDNFIIIEYL